ncbi:hypothetical protein [Flavobacterium kingsejongi]|uniref:Uncharacterized protein n=1 Tax=Flavobacterium kingsejongi TaxID=1678728 RepID=A0A2S1LJV7_9FLAO|nr:hypothetical protein [Flavobacterium kingsejongi]AWG23786.1 hypothetical protein FK004_00360 [Flavobacterium kingsejongi]
MKKIFFFLAVAGSTFFTSCSSDDDVASSIVLTSNVPTVVFGETFTLTVKTDLAVDVTAGSQFFVNNVAISSNVFTPPTGGTYTIRAVNGTLTSADITVKVTAPLNSFVVNGTVYNTETSILVYLGTDENSMNNWIAAGYNALTENEMDVYFTTPQVGAVTLEYPTAANFVFGATPGSQFLYGIIGEDELEGDEESLTALNLNLTTINVPQVAGDPQNWTYTYDAVFVGGETVVGNFSGDYLFYNASTPAGKTTVQPIKRIHSSSLKNGAKKAYLNKK